MICDNCDREIVPGERKIVTVTLMDGAIEHEVHADLTVCFRALRGRIESLEADVAAGEPDF